MPLPVKPQPVAALGFRVCSVTKVVRQVFQQLIHRRVCLGMFIDDRRLFEVPQHHCKRSGSKLQDVPHVTSSSTEGVRASLRTVQCLVAR
jgi:hypothetical protein